MSSLPGWSLSAALEAKQDAQLAVHGQSFEYISQSAGNFPLTACKDKGAREGDQIYFRLHAKPSAFPVPPLPGDRILTEEKVWYVATEVMVEDGWQVMLFHRQGSAI